jgi:ribosome-binding protein aMBF1 (putative translation factor)
MRFECSGCKKSFSGSGLIVALNGQQLTYCADCLWKLRKEYDKKKTCEDCGYFDEESCKKTRATLAPVKVGYNTYFVEAETCKDYSTEKKAIPAKKSDKELTQMQKEAAALVKNLAQKGKTLTYHCCHCGTPLKIGAKATEIQKTCPRCKGDLEIINLSKFIKQHQS